MLKIVSAYAIVDGRSNLSDHNALCFVFRIEGKISCIDTQQDTDMQSQIVGDKKRIYWDDHMKIEF